MSPRTFLFSDGIEPERFHLNAVNVGASVLAAVLLYRLGLVVYRLWFHPLSSYPGPKLWAASTIPYVYTSGVAGSAVHKIDKFHRKYGPIVRIGPNRLVLDGSIAWPQIYAHRSGSKLEYEKTPGVFAEGIDISIIAAPHDVHRRQRRQLGHAFSDTAMYEQEPTLKKYIDLLSKRVREHAVAGKSMNIIQWLNFTTFDVIGDLALGEPFGSLEGSTYHPWVLGIFKGIRADSFLWACRNYPTFAPLLIGLFGRGQKEVGDMARHLAWTKGGARMALGEEPKGRRDFMTYMLRKNRDGEPGMSPVEIMANSISLILAGSETTASALSGFFFYLGMTPRVKQLVMEEIRSTFQDESEIEMKSVAKLEYLHATLQEILRVYPPAAITPSRDAPAGAEIEGKYIPEGTTVHVSQWATFRNPEHFADAEGFHPERWLRPAHPRYDARFAGDNVAVFKPFSTGPRDCIGKNLAYSEMRMVTARLLFQFDFELAPGQDDWHAKQRVYTVWEKGPLEVSFKLRGTA